MRLALILLCLCASGAEYWVSPSGSNSNAGTFAAPWAITKVFPTSYSGANASVAAGDTVWLRGGTYDNGTAALYANLVGTAGSRITVAGVPGEAVVLQWGPLPMAGSVDAMFKVVGSYTTFKNFKVQWTGDKLFTLGGGNQAWAESPNSLSVTVGTLGNPTGNIFANLVAQDGAEFVNATSSDYASTYYGTIAYGLGFDSGDRLHGGFAYIQNDETNGTETHKHNVSLSSPYNFNYRLYTTGGTARGVSAIGNIIWGMRVYDSTAISTASFSDNFIIGLYQPGTTSEVAADGNTMVLDTTIELPRTNAAVSLTDTRLAILQNGTTYYPISYSTYSTSNPLSGNEYVASPGSVINYCVHMRNAGGTAWLNYNAANFASWLALGFDSGSTCANTVASNWTSTFINEYESGRAHIATYNWTGATSEPVDVSGFLADGDRWEALDLWTPNQPPVASGILSGTTISLPLTGTSYYTPWGDGATGSAARPRACWEVDRANCLTSGDYVVAASVGALPAGTSTYQAALLSSDYSVYYWDGNSWESAGVTIDTHSGPVYERKSGVHVFLVRRLYDNRNYTSVAWHGDTTGLRAGYKLPGGTYSWELPIIGASCTDGLCSARIPQAVGDAWIDLNGTIYKMAAR
jgi:hypothetical protein